MIVYLTHYYYSDCCRMGDYEILGCFDSFEKAEKKIYSVINEKAFGDDIKIEKELNKTTYLPISFGQYSPNQILSTGQYFEIIELEVI